MTGAAIVGLGITEVGKVYGRSASSFALEAVRLAVADAGLSLGDVDGLLVSSGLKRDLDISLGHALSLGPLGLLAQTNSLGATASSMVAQAAQAIAAGQASVVVCVFADAPLKPRESTGAAYAAPRGASQGLTGLSGWQVAGGVVNANAMYALAARRHMERYGTTSAQLGQIAVAQRAWAAMNPLAQMRDPITLADHQASRWIAEPLHLLDCCLVSNGGIAIVVTSAERAASLAQPAVHLWGYGQAHEALQRRRGSHWGVITPAARSGKQAMSMAGISTADVDICQIYDCYTYTVLVTLEDYGFCAKGEGGAFVEDGKLAPGGGFPMNTGGGQLSSYYLWGMTPLSEAIIQARGQAGARQASATDVILVSGNGGVLEHHGTLVLSPTGPRP